MVVVLVLIQPVITLWFLALERLSTLSLEVVDEEKVHILVGTKLVTVKVEKVVKDNITLVIQLAQTYTIVVGGGEGWTSSAVNNGQNSSGFGVTANGGRANYITGPGIDGTYYANFNQFGAQNANYTGCPSNCLGWFGGSGGSGRSDSGSIQYGGKGGGGWGDNSQYGGAFSGGNGAGGGGGGAGAAYAAGNGGHGVVLVRYANNAFTTLTEGGNATLQSVDTTAVDGAPTKADLIMLIEKYGTATLNTDIKGYISRDSGTTFTQGTLVDEEVMWQVQKNSRISRS